MAVCLTIFGYLNCFKSNSDLVFAVCLHRLYIPNYFRVKPGDMPFSAADVCVL